MEGKQRTSWQLQDLTPRLAFSQRHWLATGVVRPLDKFFIGDPQ